MTATDLAGLLCPAVMMVGYIILMCAFRTPAAQFRNRNSEE